MVETKTFSEGFGWNKKCNAFHIYSAKKFYKVYIEINLRPIYFDFHLENCAISRTFLQMKFSCFPFPFWLAFRSNVLYSFENTQRYITAICWSLFYVSSAGCAACSLVCSQLLSWEELTQQDKCEIHNFYHLVHIKIFLKAKFWLDGLPKIYFLTFPACFWIPINFFQYEL